MFSRLMAACVAAAFVLMGMGEIAQAKTELKMATQAPKRSPWGKVFRTWSKAVKKKTKGKVKVTWLWNGTAGPESGVVGKVKSNQLSGAAVTAVGLASIDKRFLALQIPGAFKSWGQLDRARNKLTPALVTSMAKHGFYLGTCDKAEVEKMYDAMGKKKGKGKCIASFGDVGIGRVFSKGFAVKVPSDLRGKRPGAIAKDVIAPKVYESIGGVTPVPSSITGFLPKLNSGGINVMNTPSLAAELLQWASRLDHVNTHATYFGIGAVIMSEKSLKKLSADERFVVRVTGAQAAAALTKRIRRADDKAFKRLKKKMKVHEPSGAEKKEWKKVFKKACKRLKGAIPAGALKKVGAC